MSLSVWFLLRCHNSLPSSSILPTHLYRTILFLWKNSSMYLIFSHSLTLWAIDILNLDWTFLSVTFMIRNSITGRTHTVLSMVSLKFNLLRIEDLIKRRSGIIIFRKKKSHQYLVCTWHCMGLIYEELYSTIHHFYRRIEWKPESSLFFADFLIYVRMYLRTSISLSKKRPSQLLHARYVILSLCLWIRKIRVVSSFSRYRYLRTYIS